MLKKFATILIIAISGFPAFSEDMAKMRLLPGWVNDGGNHVFGVEIALNPGWKTYWRSPGGNGIPPQFDWTGSQNIGHLKIHWPSPQVLDSFGFKTVGYSDNVVFPVEIVPKNPNKPVSVALNLFYGICKDVCIPASANGQLKLAEGSVNSKKLIKDALATKALSKGEAGVKLIICEITPTQEGFNLDARITLKYAPSTNPYTVVETGNANLIAMPVSGQTDGNLVQFSTKASFYGTGGMIVDRSQFVITLLFSNQTIELAGCPA